MSEVWMVRAGERGRLFEEFEKGYVAIGWQAMGDMSSIGSQEEMRRAYVRAYPDNKPGSVGNAAAMAYKFTKVFAKGDKVITYNPEERKYRVGEITGDYEYRPNVVGDYPHLRKVNWTGTVDRDVLPSTTRNALGSTLTLFSVSDESWHNFQAALKGEVPATETETDEKEVLDSVREQSREFIKDRIVRFSPREFEDFVAGLLRAMGYKTRVSPIGPDRGIDIMASPDGFGFEQPRIAVECKHRTGAIGAQQIRSFLGGRHKDDKGLYVSTGGFTKDARYEAERASIPMTLLDLDDLVDSVTEYYEQLDSESRTLLPLVKVYWPVQ
jgi:restriction system protein